MAIQKNYMSMNKELSLLGLYMCYRCNETECLSKCRSSDNQKMRNIYICSNCAANVDDSMYKAKEKALKS